MTVLAHNPPELPATTAQLAVRTVGLKKSIDDRMILAGIDLKIASGEFVAILGANGAGKTTLLKIIATLAPASSGDLYLFGQQARWNPASLRARIGLIADQPMLYRELSARENLRLFAALYGIPNPEQCAVQSLRMIGLSKRGDDPVKSFSRGMVQRIAIARALISDPELILADEPFAGLDVPSILSLEKLFADLCDAGRTVVLVNHDIEQTLRIAYRAIVLRNGVVMVDELAGRLYAQEVLSEVGS